MYGFILGFHRLVWWPKWTPASSRFIMVTSVIRSPGSSPPFLKKCRKPAPYQTAPGGGNVGSLVHRIEELLVRLRTANLVVEELHRLDRVELREELAQDPHPVQHVARQEKLLLPGSRPRHVHGREHALIHEAPVEVDLHVAGTLELLEDDLVHPAARVDECRADDGEAAPVLDVARGAEELLGTAEGVRVDTAREDLSARRHDRVIGPRETR